MIEPNPILGTALHAVGAVAAALCYTPQKKVTGWSWQSYWIVQALFCWLLLPILVAFVTVPNLAEVLQQAPKDAMRHSFLLGAAYGIGGTAFGISIRYIGFSLTYAIAIGLSTVLGTLIPSLVKGELGDKLSKTGASWVIAGIVVGLIGIALTGAAGRMKEKDLEAQTGPGEFNLVKGLLLSLLAGVLSAVYAFSLEAGKPVADTALALAGADARAQGFAGNVVYIFSNTGAFLTTSLYCIWLHRKQGTFGEILKPATKKSGALQVNWLMALLTGCLWYGQFFFYNLGHIRMGGFQFTSWAIHMIMLILFSIVVGWMLHEWRASQGRTKWVLAFAFLVLVGAVLCLSYGNYLGEAVAGH
jgi:L-rhamnose-H+ transport protein